MRTVWAQATRPRLSSIAAPRACPNSIAARRSAAANASRPELAACDIFAFFLGPVLAAAAFADVSWKESKRKEWEKRFAEINGQLEALRAREVEVWTRIQYHSVRHGFLQHKRMYSTAAATVTRDQQSALIDGNHPLFDHTTPDETETTWGESRASPDPSEAGTLLSETLGSLPVNSPLLRYEKLLALRLALRMMLHVYTGSDEIRTGQARDHRPDGSAEDIGKIVIRLRAVTDELDRFDRRWSSKQRKKPFRHNAPENQSTEALCRAETYELNNLYRNNRIDIAGLIDRLSQRLLRPDQKPPGPEFYARIVMLFSVNDLPELAKYAVSALQNTTYILDNMDICFMLTHSSMTRNYKAYNWVIHNLTDEKGMLTTERSHWQWLRLSGLLLPVPRDHHPTVVRALLRAALNFDDAKRAEAYSTVPSVRRSGQTMGYVIKAFLQYYAKEADWTNGRRWLQEASDWVSSRRSPTHVALSAVLVRVFDFLLAFGMNQEYRKLLSLVVHAGIEPPAISKRTRESSKRICRIVDQWRALVNKEQPSMHRDMAFAKVKASMRDVVADLPGGDSSPLHMYESSSSHILASDDQLSAEATLQDNSYGNNSDPAKDDSNPSVVAEEPATLDQIFEIRDVALDEEMEAKATPMAKAPRQQGAAVNRFDVESLLELNKMQREKFYTNYRQQQQVIEEQQDKLKEFQSSLASLKALLYSHMKAAENLDLVQSQQKQKMQEQDTKIKTLEDKIQSLQDLQELGSSSPPAPPPYPGEGPTSTAVPLSTHRSGIGHKSGFDLTGPGTRTTSTPPSLSPSKRSYSSLSQSLQDRLAGREHQLTRSGSRGLQTGQSRTPVRPNPSRCQQTRHLSSTAQSNTRPWHRQYSVGQDELERESAAERSAEAATKAAGSTGQTASDKAVTGTPALKHPVRQRSNDRISNRIRKMYISFTESTPPSKVKVDEKADDRPDHPDAQTHPIQNLHSFDPIALEGETKPDPSLPAKLRYVPARDPPIAHFVFASPRRRKTGDPQGRGNFVQKGRPLRQRLKYPHLNPETFRIDTHLRYVNTKEGNPAAPRTSQGEVDALDGWDASLGWEE